MAWHLVLVNALLALAALHVLAVLLYWLVGRRNLLAPMITGRKRLPGRLRAPRMQGNVLAAAFLGLAVLATWVVVRMGEG